MAPENVETMRAATFRVYQDNASKFQHNKRLTEGRKRRLKEAGAVRAPTNAECGSKMTKELQRKNLQKKQAFELNSS